MLGDGTKAKEAEDAIGTYDVSELLAMSVFGAENKSLYRKKRRRICRRLCFRTSADL